MSSQYKHYDAKKNFKTTYTKNVETPLYNYVECTHKFIKPRTSYDEMIKNFISGNSFDLPIEKDFAKNNWK